jgi:hypothetical protein
LQKTVDVSDTMVRSLDTVGVPETVSIAASRSIAVPNTVLAHSVDIEHKDVVFCAVPDTVYKANEEWTTVVNKKKKAKTCKDLEPPFGTIHGDEPPDEADPDPVKTQALLGVLQSWYGADDSSEEEDDDSSHGYISPLMGRQYMSDSDSDSDDSSQGSLPPLLKRQYMSDSDSDDDSCGDVPPLMERGTCDDSSSSDDDSFIAPTRGWRPKYDDSDDDDSIATDDNKEFEMFLDLDMQLHVEDEAGRELAIPTV